MARDPKRHKKYVRVWIYIHPEDEDLLDRAASSQNQTFSSWARTELIKFAKQERGKPPASESPIRRKRPSENFERRRIVLMSHLEHAEVDLAARCAGDALGKWAANHLLDIVRGANRLHEKNVSEAKESLRGELQKQIAAKNPPKWLLDLITKHRK
jgi:hypothetical protein